MDPRYEVVRDLSEIIRQAKEHRGQFTTYIMMYIMVSVVKMVRFGTYNQMQLARNIVITLADRELDDVQLLNNLNEFYQDLRTQEEEHEEQLADSGHPLDEELRWSNHKNRMAIAEMIEEAMKEDEEQEAGELVAEANGGDGDAGKGDIESYYYENDTTTTTTTTIHNSEEPSNE